MMLCFFQYIIIGTYVRIWLLSKIAFSFQLYVHTYVQIMKSYHSPDKDKQANSSNRSIVRSNYDRYYYFLLEHSNQPKQRKLVSAVTINVSNTVIVYLLRVDYVLY